MKAIQFNNNTSFHFSRSPIFFTIKEKPPFCFQPYDTINDWNIKWKPDSIGQPLLSVVWSKRCFIFDWLINLCVIDLLIIIWLSWYHRLSLWCICVHLPIVIHNIHLIIILIIIAGWTLILVDLILNDSFTFPTQKMGYLKTAVHKVHTVCAHYNFPSINVTTILITLF